MKHIAISSLSLLILSLPSFAETLNSKNLIALDKIEVKEDKMSCCCKSGSCSKKTDAKKDVKLLDNKMASAPDLTKDMKSDMDMKSCSSGGCCCCSKDEKSDEKHDMKDHKM